MMGWEKSVRAYAGSLPAWVFLNRHLSYAGSVRLTDYSYVSKTFVLSLEMDSFLMVEMDATFFPNKIVTHLCQSERFCGNDQEVKWKVKERNFPMKMGRPWQEPVGSLIL